MTTFLQLLLAVYTCLEAMTSPSIHPNLGYDWNWDGETVTKANGYMYQLQSSSFLVASRILIQVLHSMKELTLKLQQVAMDVVEAFRMVLAKFKLLQRDSEMELHKVFVEH